MLNPDAIVVAKLQEIGLKVYPEYTSNLQASDAPCITYYQYDNMDYTKARDLGGYGQITYKVRVWATDLSQLNSYSSSVDAKMRDLGFDRLTTLEDWQSNLGYKEMKFQNLYFEYYNS